MIETKINKIGGIGASEIGKLYTREGLKAKTAKTLALDKAIEIVRGERKRFTTVATQHGIFNEEEAFYSVVKPSYPNAVYRSADSIPIKQGLWATPDVVDVSNDCVIDIKCPYAIDTYYKNVNKPVASYLAQLQCQMLATGLSKGMLCIYLTSNRIDEHGNKIEYDIDINDRHCFIPIDGDKETQEDMLVRVDEFFKMRDFVVDDIKDAPEVSDNAFFHLHKDHKVTRLRDKSNPMAWGGSIIHNGDFYYVIEQKLK